MQITFYPLYVLVTVSFSTIKKALCSSQSALLVLSLFSDRVEQFLRILRLPGELLLLPAGCLGFLHAAKFLGSVFQQFGESEF